MKLGYQNYQMKGGDSHARFFAPRLRYNRMAFGMPIIKPAYSADAEALIKTARIEDAEDRARFIELLREAESRPGAAVYEIRSVLSITDDDVTIGAAAPASPAAPANTVTFHARPLCRLFSAGMTVYPYVATCGTEMAAFGKTLTDPLEQYWWDIIMQSAVGSALRALTAEVERLSGGGLKAVNPGSIQLWPISNQPALFSLIGDVQQMIGVQIAPSFLMIPLKSVSGIYFQGEGEFTHNCSLCERENCPNRRAPFDAKLKAELEGDARSMFE